MLGEWVTSEARDLADIARQRAHEATRGTKEYALEAKEYVQGAVHRTKESLAQAREYVEGTAHQARDRMSKYREGGIERMKDHILGYTREQPLTALLIAAAVGLVLGWRSAAGRR